MDKGNKMSENEGMAKVEYLMSKFEENECGGSIAEPWKYCDDCNEWLEANTQQYHSEKEDLEAQELPF